MATYRREVLEPAAVAPKAHAEPAESDWLAFGDELAAADAATDGWFEHWEDAPEGVTPWRQRRGPAYPDDGWASLGRDLKEWPHTLWDDTKATFTNPVVLVGLLVAGAAGITINATGVDETVADRTHGHRHLSRSLDGVGGFFGSPAFHFPLAGAMYATGLAIDNPKLYETSKTMMNALIINGVLVQSLKWATRTASPNGDELGWPSGHTASSFTVATVVYEAYGPWYGVPALAFATFVGYERIDARNHDFSDVVSGAVLGIIIGHAVAGNNKGKIFGMTLLPFADPETGTVGIALGKQW